MARETYITSLDGETTDNYECTCEQWREIFLKMDHKELAQRFSLQSDEEALYIVYFGQKYRLDRKTGMICLVDEPERIPGFNTLMAIYHLFYYAKPGAEVRGEFVPFRSVKRAAPFDPAFQKTVLKPLAEVFDGHADLLEKACIALNGTPIRQGDVGYVIDAFDCVPLTVVFWDGDDEFAAQSNILFDADITDFFHEETVVCLASDFVRRLGEEAGIMKVKQLMGGDIMQ